MRSQSPPGPANPRPFLSKHTFRQDPLTNSIDRHRAIGHPPPHPAKTSATEDSSRQVITHPARNISCHRTACSPARGYPPGPRHAATRLAPGTRRTRLAPGRGVPAWPPARGVPACSPARGVPACSPARGVPACSPARGVPACSPARGVPACSPARGVPACSPARGVPACSPARGVPACSPARGVPACSPARGVPAWPRQTAYPPAPRQMPCGPGPATAKALYAAVPLPRPGCMRRCLCIHTDMLRGRTDVYGDSGHAKIPVDGHVGSRPADS